MLGSLAFFLGFAALLVFLCVYLLRKLPLLIISKVLKLELTIARQTGTFAFQNLHLKNSVVNIDVSQCNFRLNLLKLLKGSDDDQVALEVDSIKGEVKEEAKSFYTSKEKTEIKKEISGEPDINTLAKVFLAKFATFFLLRRLSIRIKNVDLKIGSIRIVTSLTVKYSRRKSLELSILVNNSEFKIRETKKIAFNSFELEFSASADFSAIVCLLTGDIPPTHVHIPSLSFGCDGSCISLALNKTTLRFVGAVAELSLKVAFSQHLALPIGDITITEVTIDRMSLVSFDSLIVDLVSETIKGRFIEVQGFQFSIPDLATPDLFDCEINGVSLNYTTLDGLNLFRLVKQIQSPSTETSRPVLDFPRGHALVKALHAKLTMTDEAIIELKAEEGIELKEQSMTLRHGRVWICGSEMGKLEDVILSSPDRTFLQIQVGNAYVYHDQSVVINSLIDNILSGWKIIKPLVSKGIFDSETLPLPIRILVTTAEVNIPDKLVNMRTAEMARILPEFLKEAINLRYILSEKLKTSNLAPYKQSRAVDKLEHVLFEKYREMLKQAQTHKWHGKYSLKVADVQVELDSRGVVNKLEIIRELAPDTPAQGEKFGWDTLEGLKVNLHVGSASFSVIDIERNILEARDVSCSALLIVAEAFDGNQFTKETTVLGRTYSVPFTLTPIKLYSRVRFDIDHVNVCFGVPYLQLLADLGDIISDIIPPSSEPSPELCWWDKLRSMFWGEYDFHIKLIEVGIFAGTRYYNHNDNLIMRVREIGVEIRDSAWKVDIGSVTLRRLGDGPKLLRIRSILLTVSMVWDTPCHDQRKHIFFRDMSRHNDPRYDTYEQFRAAGLEATIVLTVGRKREIPFAEFDFAHIQWVLAPLLEFVNMSPIFAPAKKKGSPVTRPLPKLSSFTDLRTRWNITFAETRGMSVRLWDHFRESEKPGMNCSVEVTFVNPSLSVTAEMNNHEFTCNEGKACIQTIVMNTTDVPSLCKNISGLSTTFFILRELQVDFSQRLLSIGGIKIYGNQFYGIYLWDFLKSLLAMAKRPNRPVSEPTPEKPPEPISEVSAPPRGQGLLQRLLARTESQKTVTVDKGLMGLKMRPATEEHVSSFVSHLACAKMPLLEIVYESVAVDGTMYFRMENLNIDLRQSKDERLFVRVGIPAIAIVPNRGYDQDFDPRSAIFHIRKLETDFWEENGENIKATIGGIDLTAHAGDIALINQFKDEIFQAVRRKPKRAEPAPESDQTNAPPSIIKLRMDCIVNEVNVDLLNEAPLATIGLQETRLQVSLRDTGSREISGSIRNAVVTDYMTSELPKKCLDRWLANRSSDVKAPMIGISLIDSGVSADSLPMYSGEITSQPMLVYFDLPFYKSVRAAFLKDSLRVGTFASINFGLPRHPFILPKGRSFSMSVIPEIDCTYRRKNFRVAEKMARIQVGVPSPQNADFFIQRLKINRLRICLSALVVDGIGVNDMLTDIPSITVVNATTNMDKLTKTIGKSIGVSVVPIAFRHLADVNGPALDESLLAELAARTEEEKRKMKAEILFGKSMVKSSEE